MSAVELQLACSGLDGHGCSARCTSFLPTSGLPFMCTICEHHRARHNQHATSLSPSSTPPPLFIPLKRPTAIQPVSPTSASSAIPIAPALTNPKKKQHKLTEQFKARQQHHHVYVHQLGCGQLVTPAEDGTGAEGGVVEVKLSGSGASVWLPRPHCTETCWLHVRSFHNFQPKSSTALSASLSPSNSSASLSASTTAAAVSGAPPLSPSHLSTQPPSPLSSFTVEVDLNSSLLAGLVHPIMDAYAQYGVELEEEEVRLIANGRELTFASIATSASTMLADCPHLIPFSTLLLIYDPQSSFTLDPLSSTSPSLVLSSNLLTVSITSDSKWCSIRASHPFTRGIHTWRLRMNQCTSGNVFVGVCTEQAKMSQYLGNDASGFGYYGCGNTYRQGSSRSYGSAYRTGDVITVVLDCDARKLSFRKNDESLGVAFEDLPSSLYPALSLYSKNDSVSIVDFGSS